MDLPTFYVDNELKVGSVYTLSHNEIQHAHVVRLSEGDMVSLYNGRGMVATGILSTIDYQRKKIHSISTRVTSVDTTPPPLLKLTLAVAMPKRWERIRFLLEKCTELGVHSISPFYSQHSERMKLDIHKCRRVLIETMKQSHNLYLPLIREATHINHIWEEMKRDEYEQKWIAHCVDNETRTDISKLLQTNNLQSVFCMIGPEGDFSTEEIEKARDLNFIELSLGENRLRTETAVIHVASLLYATGL